MHKSEVSRNIYLEASGTSSCLKSSVNLYYNQQQVYFSGSKVRYAQLYTVLEWWSQILTQGVGLLILLPLKSFVNAIYVHTRNPNRTKRHVCRVGTVQLLTIASFPVSSLQLSTLGDPLTSFCCTAS